MPKYSVYGVITGSKFLGEFEADSPKEAKEMAMESEENEICLCHYCSDQLELNDYSFSDLEVIEKKSDQ